MPAPPKIAPPDKPQQPAPEGRAENSVRERKQRQPGNEMEKAPPEQLSRAVNGRRAGAQRQTETETQERHRVGKKTLAQIGDGQHNDEAGENRPFEPDGSQSKHCIAGSKKDSRKKLDKRIEHGDFFLAIAAAAPKQQPAQHGNVVEGLDGSPALRAARARADDGLLGGDPDNAHVQKAANDQAEQKAEGHLHETTVP